MDKEISIVEIKQEINKVLSDKETLKTLLTVTFKGLDENLMKRAALEAMMRGFEFKDFLEKNIYAIPFKNRGVPSYTLVNSIDYVRKVGMRSGVVGESAPIYEMKDNNIIFCTVAVKRKVENYIGEYAATAFFTEYNTGDQQWAKRPKTMIAKVAEMQALRKACPEEFAQAYIEEEFDKEKKEDLLIEEKTLTEVEGHKAKLQETKTIQELASVWQNIPGKFHKELETLKNELKLKYANP